MGIIRNDGETPNVGIRPNDVNMTNVANMAMWTSWGVCGMIPNCDKTSEKPIKASTAKLAIMSITLNNGKKNHIAI